MRANRGMVVGFGLVLLVLPGDASADKTPPVAKVAKAEPAAAKPAKVAVANPATAKPPAPPPPKAAESIIDPLGVKMIHPTRKGGRTWFSKWNTARDLRKGATDPGDSEFQNRGGGTFGVAADGVATANGALNRHYIWDQSAAKKWQNIEVTFYGNYTKLQPAAGAAKPPPSGLMIEVRTGDGHVDEPARQCDGASYSLALYDDGRAEFKKEAKHPVYSTKNPTAKVWPGGGTMPEGKWIGFKATIRDVGDSVELALYRDMTDGAQGGTWEKVLDYTDAGAWSVGDGSPICGQPANRKLTGAFPVVLFRNDNAVTKYKKASVREIAP